MEAAFPRTAVMVPTCWTFPAPTIRRRSRFECIKPSTSHRTGDRSIHHDAENHPSRKSLQTMICIFSLSKCVGQLEMFELHSFIKLFWFYQKCLCNSQHTYALYVCTVCVCVFNLCVFLGLPGSASSHSGRLDARLPRSRQEPAAVSAHDVSPTTAEEDTRRCAKTYKKRFLKFQFHGFSLEATLWRCKESFSRFCQYHEFHAISHMSHTSLCHHTIVCSFCHYFCQSWLQRQVLERIWDAWRWTRASLLFA